MMRDHIRERDLETVGGQQATIDVDDRGVATITIRRDDLDAVLRRAHRSPW